MIKRELQVVYWKLRNSRELNAIFQLLLFSSRLPPLLPPGFNGGVPFTHSHSARVPTHFDGLNPTRTSTHPKAEQEKPYRYA